MAMTASLALDIKAFQAGLDKAEVELQTFERATKSVNRDLKRLMEDVSGQKVVAEAERMAEAVKRIGGASLLTEAEQGRVNATVTEALAKYRALGQEAPAHLVALKNATASATTSTSSLVGAVGQMAAAFSAANLIQKGASMLFSFGAAALQSAGDLKDLSGALDVSLGRLQEWQQVAKQGGVELDVLTKGAFRLGDAILAGGTSTVAAVERLGLSFGKLADLKPEDQMDAVLRAAERLGPSQERNSVLVDLFGEKGALALARVVDGYDDVTRAAVKSGDAQVLALAKAGDEWDHFIDNTIAKARNLGGNLVLLGKDIANGVRPVQGMAGGEFFPELAASDAAQAAADAQAAAAKAVVAAQAPAIAAAKDYVAALASMKSHIGEVVAAQGPQLAAAVAMGASTEAITRQFKLSEEEQRVYASMVRDTAGALKTTTAEQEKFNAAVAAFGGAAALKDAAEMGRVLTAIGGPTKVLPDQLDAVAKKFAEGAAAARMVGNVRLAERYQAMAQALSPIAQLQQRYNVTIGEYVTQGLSAAEVTGLTTDQLAELTGQVQKILPPLQAAGFAWVGFKGAVDQVNPALLNTETRMQRVARESAQTAGALRQLSGALSEMSQISGGKDLGTLATIVGGMAGAAEGTSQFTNALSGMREKTISTGAGLVQMAAAASTLAVALGNVTSSGNKAMNVISGIGTGAAAGAAIGTAFGPGGTGIGALIGGGVGLIAGLFGGTKKKAAEVTQVVTDWPKLLKDATDEAGHLSAAMKATVQQMVAAGTATQEIKDFLKGQGAAVLEGFNAVAKDGETKWQAYGDAVKKAADERKKALEDGSASDTLSPSSPQGAKFRTLDDALTQALTAQHAAAEAAAPALKDLGIQAVAAFNAAQASGMSFTESLKAAQPGLQSIIKAYESLGINIDDAALKVLTLQSGMLAKNPELLAGLDGLAQGFVAMNNLGVLNEDTFASMQRTALDMFSRLQGEMAAAGADTRTNVDALRPMQKYLQEAAAAAAELGLPLDANTKMLIDQSKELGLWKDKGKPPMEEMRDAVLEMKDAILEMVTAMGKIPSRITTDVTTRYSQEGTPGTNTPGLAPVADPRVTAPSTASDGERTIYVPVYIDGRQVAEASAPYLPGALSRRGV